jgi:hypothetical protein
MLIKDNPFRLNYISGGESFITSKVLKEFIEKWGGQKVTKKQF